MLRKGKLLQDKFVYRAGLMEMQYSAIEKPCDQDTSDMVKLKLIPGSRRKVLDTGLYGSYIPMRQINKRSTWIIDPAPLFVGRFTWLLELHPLLDGIPFGIRDSRVLFVKRKVGTLGLSLHKRSFFFP